MLSRVFLFLFLSCLVGHSAAAEDQWPLGVIGEIETVGIVEAGLLLPARIDTGAQTSSINALDIKKFERDGKAWVAFHLPAATQDKEESQRAADTAQKIEVPVVRTATIKRHGTEAVERPVVMLTIMMGTTALEREFSLTDRSQFAYPVLIGRNVLQGQAAVDVARKEVLETQLPEPAEAKK